MKREIKISTALLLLVLLVVQYIPHHHHHDMVCTTVEHNSTHCCDDNNKENHHSHPASNHCNPFCIENAHYLSSNNQNESRISTQKSNNENLWSASISLFLESYKDTDNKKLYHCESLHYKSIFYNSGNGLRAPPVVFV